MARKSTAKASANASARASGTHGDFSNVVASIDTDHRPTTRDFGNLSVYSVTEPIEIKARSDVWNFIPGMATGVGSVQGDDLEISVSLEIFQPGGSTWIRAVVDGAAAEPSDVLLKSGSSRSDGIRTFTFIKRNMKTGQHLVEIQMLTSKNTYIKSRILTVHSASPLSGWDRKITRARVSGPKIKGTSSWQDIPGMSSYLRVETASTLTVDFSAEAWVSAGKMLVRAMVDGTEIGQVIFVEAGSSSRFGTRSFTFVCPNIGSITSEHYLVLQWKGSGGTPSLGDHTMSINAVKSDIQKVAAINPTSQVVMKVPNEYVLNNPISFETTHTVSNVAVTVSTELRSVKGRVYLQVFLDGEVANPSDVILADGGSMWRATSCTIVVKNVLKGRHQVYVQFVIGSNTEAYYRRSTVRVLLKQRRGPDFVQPFPGLNTELMPIIRGQRLLVIGFDPVRPAHARPSFAQIKKVFEGDDSVNRGPNLIDWISENSGGLVSINEIRYVGCQDNKWYKAPVAHQGDWYWDNDNFAQMRKDALKLADADVDFHAYDVNKDSTIDTNELVVVIVLPQNGVYGALRGASASFVGGTTALHIANMIDLYLSSDTAPAKHLNGVGTAAHEFVHTYGTLDLYGVCESINSGLFSVMDVPDKATHLDPFHKMKLGWVQPLMVDLTGLTNVEIVLHSVEQHKRVLILHDADHIAREYFMIEYRYPGMPGNMNYDGQLDAPSVVIWQIFEDMNLVETAVRCTNDPRFIRKYSYLTSPNGYISMEWADGTDLPFWISVSEIGGEYARVRISK